MSECGDLARFKNQDSFTGYLGLYPTLQQSGNKTVHQAIAKRGAKLAKKALYEAAIASVRHNKELNKLFHDKVSSGRAKKEAIVIVARKSAQHRFSYFCAPTKIMLHITLKGYLLHSIDLYHSTI